MILSAAVCLCGRKELSGEGSEENESISIDELSVKMGASGSFYVDLLYDIQERVEEVKHSSLVTSSFTGIVTLPLGTVTVIMTGRLLTTSTGTRMRMRAGMRCSGMSQPDPCTPRQDCSLCPKWRIT